MSIPLMYQQQMRGSVCTMPCTDTPSSGHQRVLRHSWSIQPPPQLFCCAICGGRFVAPKVLPCLHTFCESCLTDYIPTHSLSVTCPSCRCQSILPEAGVKALQANAFIGRHLLAMSQKAQDGETCDLVLDGANGVKEGQDGDGDVKGGGLKTDGDHLNDDAKCNGDYSDDGELNNASSESSQKDDGNTVFEDEPLTCPGHAGGVLDLYCVDCETAICSECTHGEHSSHGHVVLSDAIDEHTRMLHSLVAQTRCRLPHIDDASEALREAIAMLGRQREDADMSVSAAFDTLATELALRRSAIAQKVQCAHERRHQLLDKRLETLTSLRTNIEACCEFTNRSLQHGGATELLLLRKQMTRQLQELASTPTDDSLERGITTADNHIVFNDNGFSHLHHCIAKLGSVNTDNGTQVMAKGHGLSRCMVSEPTSVILTTCDSHGDAIIISPTSVTAELTSTYAPNVSADVTVTDDDRLVVTYSANTSGLYWLHIRLNNEPIVGSPFRVKASVTKRSTSRGTKRASSSHSSFRSVGTSEDDLVQRVGVKGRGRGDFANPQGAAAGRAGDIVIADSNNVCVQVFSGVGEVRRRFGIRGRQTGQLQRPTGVAVNHEGHYLVADYDNRCVSVFDQCGKFINRIGSGRLLGPKGVAVDKNKRIVVVDNKASCILVFQQNGSLVRRLGCRGNAPHQLAGPHFCAITPTNDIVVTDFHNHSVKVFSGEDGSFRFCFGSNGEGNGQFNAPTGVAVDNNGNILVADWGNSRIQVFDSQGSFLSYINTSADKLYGPQGLCVTTEGHVVVADSGNHCFKIYKYI